MVSLTNSKIATALICDSELNSNNYAHIHDVTLKTTRELDIFGIAEA